METAWRITFQSSSNPRAAAGDEGPECRELDIQLILSRIKYGLN
jgi:hypothetical protein